MGNTGEEKTFFKTNFFRILKGERLTSETKCIWEDKIKMDIKEKM
jgi:hypothetical protein